MDLTLEYQEAEIQLKDDVEIVHQLADIEITWENMYTTPVMKEFVEIKPKEMDKTMLQNIVEFEYLPETYKEDF